MKLSEAMIKGCAKTRPTKRFYFSFNGECACALGAAYLGATGSVMERPDSTKVIVSLHFLTGADLTQLAEHPVTGERTDYHAIIAELNDCFGWSREDIAAWLREQGL